MHKYLISCRKKYLKSLEQNYSGRPKIRSAENSGTGFSHHRDEVITYGKILHEKIRNSLYGTMCSFPVQDKDISHWKRIIFCCLNFHPNNISFE